MGSYRVFRVLIGLGLAVASGLVSAGDWQAGNKPGHADWRQLQGYDAHMSLDDYNRTFRKNRKTLTSYVKSTTRDAFKAVGVPDRALEYVGAAISLVARDAKFKLNDSKSVTLELMNTTQSDRGIYIGFKKGW